MEVDGKKQIREVSSGSSHMSQNMLESHFGVGAASVVDTVTVRWIDGESQTLRNVSVNQRLLVMKR